MIHNNSHTITVTVTFAYPSEREGSIDAITISYCAYVHNN